MMHNIKPRASTVRANNAGELGNVEANDANVGAKNLSPCAWIYTSKSVSDAEENDT